MRRPNYKVFIYYDFNSRLYDTVKVWAVDGQKAAAKAKAILSAKNLDPEKFTFCAKGI